ncbi:MULTISPECIES: ABC transporter substrate-binding protein [Actinosynnema]|uniref:ABC transporter substrate-binding protein n=1 Tax=Actinosynnema TaxID=40566 RepID=UPI0020A4788B|nr:ABC transporter substrate-binding protein [Actinosynnema pretiosum]MCP2094625.1 iron complex transport system substrate-binding protein [Actinosynnema pretiosum]
MTPSTTGRRATAAVLTAALLAAGCGSPAPAGTAPTAAPTPVTAAATTYPLTIRNCGREITFDRAPEKVVLLNGASVSEVESFVVLGLQDRIVANSQSYGVSDDPGMVAAVKAIPTGGVELGRNREVPAEQVLALEPDLVVSTWAGGFDEKIGAVGRDRLDAAGIRSFVTPVNCSYGDPAAPQADRDRYLGQSTESSFELLLELGRIFDVQQRAADYVNAQRARMAAAEAKVAGETKKILIAYPGMSMMNSNGLPAILAGGVYDDVVARAGGVNAFAGRGSAELSEINAEALAAAEVDLLVIGLFSPEDDPAALADELFAKFPHWKAAQEREFTSLSDSLYLGPLNAIALEKLVAALHG